MVRMRTRVLGHAFVLWVAAAVTGQEGPRLMQASDLAALPQPPADLTIAYGEAKQQVAELRLPKRTGPHPVVIVIHGGCWETPWALDHVRSLAAALTEDGVATWSLEYRRLGDPGGGWRGTFEDVAAGADHLAAVAAAHRLDLERVVALGHSAGGHLALWLAARQRLSEASPLRGQRPLRLRGVVALAPIPDLRAGAEGRVCGDAIPRLLGEPSTETASRSREASPIELLPLGVPQRLVCGAQDRLVPNELSRRYREAAAKTGDAASLEMVEGAGHFELIDPTSAAWPAVRRAVVDLLH
jgi:acetyl esterase/lipase